MGFVYLNYIHKIFINCVPSFDKLIEIIVFTHTDKAGFVPVFSELTVEDNTTAIIQIVCSISG